MSDATVYIALGSNLEDPIAQVQIAIELLRSDPSINLVAQSSLYRSSPMGPQDQPDFINGVVRIGTDLCPIQLLNVLQSIEKKMGRIKGRHWGARVIDLDILLYDQLQIQTPRLTIPHPGLAQRRFVLIPLAELDEFIKVPGIGGVNKLLGNTAELDGANLEKL